MVAAPFPAFNISAADLRRAPVATCGAALSIQFERTVA